MHQTLFFLPNGIANSGTIAPFSSFHCAAIGVCMPGQSRASNASQSKLCADTSAKHQTLYLSRFSRLCNLPCSEVLSTILRGPSRFACFLSNALCFCPVVCLFFRRIPCGGIFVGIPCGGIFTLTGCSGIFFHYPGVVGFFDAQCSYGKSK